MGQESNSAAPDEQQEFFLDLENLSSEEIFGDSEEVTEEGAKATPTSEPTEETITDPPQEEEEVTAKVEEGEAETETSEEETTEESEESLFASIAKLAGIEVPEEGFEYADSEEGMLNFMNDYAEAYTERYVGELLQEQYPEVGAFLQHMMNGGDANEFMKVNHPVTDYSAVELSDTEANKAIQRKVVRDFYVAQGIKSDRVEVMLNSLEAGGSLFTTAEVAKEALSNAQEKQKQDFAEKQAADTERRQREAAQFITSVDNVLRQSAVDGIVIPKAQKAKLRTYMLQPVQGGYTQRDLAAANLSTEKQVLLSFLLMNDMNLEGLVKAKAKNEQAISLRKRLNKERESTKKGQRTPTKEKVNRPDKFSVDNISFEFGSELEEEATT